MKLTSSYKKIAEAYLGNFGYGDAYVRTYGRVSGAGYDIPNNRTKVYCKLTIYITSGQFSVYSSTTKSISCTGLSGSTQDANGTYGAGETTLQEISGYVTHNNDGTKSVTMSGNFTSTPWGFNNTASATVELPQIPRASTVACSSPFIGDTATITINKKVASFASTVTYHIKDYSTLTGTIAEKTSETVLSFATSELVDQIYALIPNDKSIAGTIRCRTYNGNTKIGDTTIANFNLYAKEDDCKPTVTGTVIDTNEKSKAITGDETKFIKYISKPKVTVSATANKSSTINSYSINLNDGQSQNLQEYTFDSIGSNTVTINAIDSRGYGNPQDIDLSEKMIDYIKLAISSDFHVARTEDVSNEVKLNCTGAWYNGMLGDVQNELSISFQYKTSDETEWTDGGTLTPTIEDNKFSFANVSLGNIYDYETEYQFKLIVSDKLDSTSRSETVPKGKEVWWESEDGIGVNGHIWLNDKEIGEKNICQLIVESNKSISIPSNGAVLIPFTQSQIIGNKLSYSGNGVKIGENVSKIKLNATLLVSADNTSDLGIYIIKTASDSNITNLSYTFDKTNGGANRSITVTDLIVAVDKDDIITCSIGCGYNPQTYTVRGKTGTYITSHICVEVID